MITKSKLIEMLQLQEKFNTSVDADWRSNKKRCDLTAILVECGELIDHMGYKWWKKQEVNLDQARMEVIDIWHFLMSDMIRGLEKTIIEEMSIEDETFDGLIHMLSVEELSEDIDDDLVIEVCKSLMAGTAMTARDLKVAVNGEEHDARLLLLASYRQLMDVLAISSEDLYTMYISKNALNHFRQQNGYKDGTYIKVWDGCEDNEHLSSILKTLMLEGDVENLFDKCLEAMQYEYNLNAK